MDKEIWKKSKSYPEKYEVSSFGRVRSISRRVKSSFNASRVINGRIVGCKVNSKRGYSRISIGGKQSLVHRLIAEVFVGNPLNLEFVNHIDGVKTNNHPANLEWCTHKENMAHARHTGLTSDQTPVLMVDPNHVCMWFPSQASASRFTGVSKTMLCTRLKTADGVIGAVRWELGCALSCPEDSEYSKLREYQNS